MLDEKEEHFNQVIQEELGPMRREIDELKGEKKCSSLEIIGLTHKFRGILG